MSVFNTKSLIFIFSIFHFFIAAYTYNCDYDKSRKHLVYKDIGKTDKHFEILKDKEPLYCDNYPRSINKSEIESISFRNCFVPPWDNGLHLRDFINLRVLNISFIGVDKIADSDMFQKNRKLECFVASHNNLTEINAFLFQTTPELIDVDFSFNKFTKINSFYWPSKLKTVNFSNNAIEHINDQDFGNLPILEILDLSDNQIKRLDCGFLSLLTELKSLDIWINTLEEIQPVCKRKCRKNSGFDIVTSSTNSSSYLSITNGKFKWILSEDDFKRHFKRNKFKRNQHSAWYNLAFYSMIVIPVVFVGILLYMINNSFCFFGIKLNN